MGLKKVSESKMILSDLQCHSGIASLFKWNFSHGPSATAKFLVLY